jgi:hypothetical protein
MVFHLQSIINAFHLKLKDLCMLPEILEQAAKLNVKRGPRQLPNHLGLSGKGSVG